MTEDQQPSQVATEDQVGALLKQRREVLGMSIEHARSYLGLTQRVFDALETDDKSRLPAPTFVRGYIKRYATLLELDAELLLRVYSASQQEIYDEQRTQDIAEKNRQVSENESRATIWFVSIVALVVLIMFWVSQSDGYQLSPTIEGTQQLQSSGEIGENLHSESTNPSPISTESKVQSSPFQVETEVAQQLFIKVKQDSWVEVVDKQGNILLIDLVSAGSTKLLEGYPPFELYTDNQQAMQVTYLNQSFALSETVASQSSRYIVGK